MTKISEICSRQTHRHAQTDIRITITVTVTVTESFVRRRLLGDRGRITQQSSVGYPGVRSQIGTGMFSVDDGK